LEGWLGTISPNQALNTLNGMGLPCGSINDAADVASDSHVKARGFIMVIEDPDVGTCGFARSAPMLSSEPDLWKDPSTNLGQQSREIIENLLGVSA
tara:strand:- start:92 stop:379 length:288 start_codon:yes stop_codon:yes gene_type:complete